MNPRFLAPRIVCLTCGSILCLVLGFLAVYAPMAVTAQANYSTPFTFTTLAAKTESGNSGGSIGILSLSSPRGLAADAAGNVFVASTRNHTICRITPAGDATVLAGRAGRAGSADGVGDTARFCYPHGLALDGNGNLYVAEPGDTAVRKGFPTSQRSAPMLKPPGLGFSFTSR